MIIRAVRKSWIHNRRDYRDFRCVPWFLAIAWFHVTAVNIDVLCSISVFKGRCCLSFALLFRFSSRTIVQIPMVDKPHVLYRHDWRSCKQSDCSIPSRPKHWLSVVSLPTYQAHADCRYIFEETAAYKQAIGETDSDVQPLTYWFANKERFPHLFDLAIRYLSVPTNSVDAERSVSQYTAVNAPQRQVIAAFNATD